MFFMTPLGQLWAICHSRLRWQKMNLNIISESQEGHCYKKHALIQKIASQQ